LGFCDIQLPPCMSVIYHGSACFCLEHNGPDARHSNRPWSVITVKPSSGSLGHMRPCFVISSELGVQAGSRAQIAASRVRAWRFCIPHHIFNRSSFAGKRACETPKVLETARYSCLPPQRRAPRIQVILLTLLI